MSQNFTPKRVPELDYQSNLGDYDSKIVVKMEEMINRAKTPGSEYSLQTETTQIQTGASQQFLKPTSVANSLLGFNI